MEKGCVGLWRLCCKENMMRTRGCGLRAANGCGFKALASNVINPHSGSLVTHLQLTEIPRTPLLASCFLSFSRSLCS